MIYGIGNDIVQLSRIERLYTRYGDALAQRLLTKQEQQEYAFSKQKTRFLAKRFAAKEAFAKAQHNELHLLYYLNRHQE